MILQNSKGLFKALDNNIHLLSGFKTLFMRWSRYFDLNMEEVIYI